MNALAFHDFTLIIGAVVVAIILYSLRRSLR